MTPLTSAIAQVFHGHTCGSASLLGLYCRRRPHDRTALEIRNNLSGERTTLAVIANKDLLAAAASALEALHTERKRLAKQTKLKRAAAA